MWLRSSLVVLISTALTAQANFPPPPGKLFDIDNGRLLHMMCSGQGSPTVILEAGASAFAIDWSLVQREIARTNRVCSYDRAGMGWSDPLPAKSIAAERDTPDLHALLTIAKEPAPYVLVGASYGGLLIRHYLAQYPTEVAGLVFVDPATEDRLFSMVRGEVFLIAEMTSDQIREGSPPWPVRIPKRAVQKGAPFDKLPADLYQQRLLLDERLIASLPETLTPDEIFRVRDTERAALATLLAQRKTSTAFGDRPTVVLSSGSERDADRKKSHADLAKLSTNSRHSVIAGAGHEIHLSDPAAVMQAITDVVDAIERKSRLPAR